MASLIEGFGYDIFISYRQKDNKYDSWVTEFVDNLNKELEATFKEEINVYFDINPHDGLLETYDVDATLKEKLNCLIFIPIISRTYCDPKSYAWEHEFKAFIEIASKDQFGLKVNLPNGNVTNRILPIQIHELKTDDKKTIENVLGCFLRSIEFIYTEPGVNRPLTPKDSEDKNLNRTNYRNQINKVANAIDMIISALRSVQDISHEKKSVYDKQRKESKAEDVRQIKEKFIKLRKTRFVSRVVIISLLILAAIITYQKIFDNTKETSDSSSSRISVAVLPFRVFPSDSSSEEISLWIQDYLINYLSSFNEDLKVKQVELINNLIKSKIQGSLSDQTYDNRYIANKLETNIYLTGTIRRVDGNMQISAQINDTKTNDILKAIEKGPSVFSSYDSLINALRVGISDYLVLTRLKTKSPAYIVPRFINTGSPDAYSAYVNGRKAFLKTDYPTARDYLFKAVQIDSCLAEADYWIALSYSNQGVYKDAKFYIARAFRKRDLVSPNVRARIMGLYYFFSQGPLERIKYLNQQIEFNDEEENAYGNLGAMYNILGRYEESISATKKSLELFKKWDSKPSWVTVYLVLGRAYHKTGHFWKEKRLYRKAEKDFPNSAVLSARQAVVALCLRKKSEADRYIEKYKRLCKLNSLPDAAISADLAEVLSDAGINDLADKFYIEALSYDPLNFNLLNNYSYFLIDREFDLKKGLEYIDKVIKSDPENYNYLDTKGWALFKQGKYQESYNTLQKSWDLRMENAIYNHEAWTHLEVAKKAVSNRNEF